MPRAPRVNKAGIYHVSNRGVDLRRVFLCHDDRIYFIELLCAYAKEYGYYIHSYSLISSGYNLLLETIDCNLSRFMKVLNKQYTTYFNKRYSRRGYLWEGRFRSWLLDEESFLFDIISYIEYLPIHTAETRDIGNYSYSSYRQFIGFDECLPCLKNSIVFRKFNTVAQIKKFFDKKIDILRIGHIHSLVEKSNNIKKDKLPELEDGYFLIADRKVRNERIYSAYKMGYSQGEIARLIGVSQQAVHKIIKKQKEIDA